MKANSFRLAILFLVLLICSTEVPFAQLIKNIDEFLSKCPTNDSMYTQIRKDFDIRRNNLPIGNITCSEPTSSIPIEQYTDELIDLQLFRVMYYMDRGKRGHLPWTKGNLYAWVKSKIDGINICDSGVACQGQINGKNYIVWRSRDATQRNSMRRWQLISSNIGTIAHEARHADGFPHFSCCGVTGGCDSTFDETNLTPYGIQWWLEKLWLTGEINVGIACLPQNEFTSIVNWHLGNCNLQFRERFCNTKPPLLSVPQSPGGPCPTSSLVEERETIRAYPLITLMQNFPNPFNPSTRIQFGLTHETTVRLSVFDLLGREVRVLINSPTQPGNHIVEWDGLDGQGKRMPSGIYFYQLQAGAFTQTKSLTLLK